MRTQLPPPPKGHNPQFSAHVCCGQMAGWIKIALGREVGLDPSNIVLDGTQLPLNKRAQPPSNFRPVSILSGWMDEDEDATCHLYLGPGHIVLDGYPAAPTKGAQHPLSLAHVCCGHGRPSQLLLSSCSLLSLASLHWVCIALNTVLYLIYNFA